MMPVQYIRFYPGKSSNAHLILFDNGKQYIVKFLKQGQEKILMNEWLGYSIARYMDLPIPPSRIVEIPAAFLNEIDQKENLIYTSKQFATLYIDDCKNGHELENPHVINTKQLAGILILDYWLFNTDRTRKNILFKEISPETYHLYIIDHADIFGSFAWNKEDLEFISKQILKSATHEMIANFIKDKNDLIEQLKVIQEIPVFLLKEILDFPPEDWGISSDEKDAILTFLINRRDYILPDLIKKVIKKYS